MKDAVDPEDPAYLTQQALSQLDLGGTAAAKTIRKLVNERTSARIQERAATGPSSIVYPPSRGVVKYTPRFLQACKRLFERCERDLGGHSIALLTLRQLTSTGAFAVDRHTMDAWLQHPRADDAHVTFGEFVDACYCFYGLNLQDRLGSETTTTTSPCGAKHPFALACARDKEARAFSPREYVSRRNPMKAQQERDANDAVWLAQSGCLRASKSQPVLRTSLSASCLAKNEADVALKRDKVVAQRDGALRQREAMQANVALAQHFSANVGMVARHVQIGGRLHPHSYLCDDMILVEITEKRHLHARVKKARFEAKKQAVEQASACAKAFTNRTKLSKLEGVQEARRDVQHDLAAIREQKHYRTEMIRRHKALFNLSESTCTLHRRPPELLAALSRAHTEAETRRLAKVEQRFFEQSLSQQLREYKHDKEHALKQTVHPPVPAAMIHLDQQDESGAWENAEAKLTAAMDALLQTWIDDQRDLSCLLPTANTPPAALRYFGKARDMPPKPFQSSTDRGL